MQDNESLMEFKPKEFERLHVHEVYQEIARHFSSTRYKAWPVVEDFIMQQESASLGGDIGCGNGKYIGLRKDLLILGCDRSAELIKIIQEKGFDGIVSDGLDTGFKSNLFDFTLSIAVIHHFSTAERRREAIKELLRITKPRGSVIIFVWAMEQEKNSKRVFTKQDEMVSWKTKKKVIGSTDNTGLNECADSQKEQHVEVTLHRFYHLFYKGELEALCEGLSCQITKVGYDRDNHYVILQKQS